MLDSGWRKVVRREVGVLKVEMFGCWRLELWAEALWSAQCRGHLGAWPANVSSMCGGPAPKGRGCSAGVVQGGAARVIEYVPRT